MPRKRMIDPSIWDDPDVGELSSDEFKLFIGCISLADDEGRLDADPRHLRKSLFGYSEHHSVEDVERLRNSLTSKLDNVHLYTISGKEYIALLRWNDHQKIGSWQRPSIIPTPSTDDLQQNLSSTCGDLGPINESIESNTTPEAVEPPPKHTPEAVRAGIIRACSAFQDKQDSLDIPPVFGDLPVFQGQILSAFYQASGLQTPRTQKRIKQATAAAEMMYQELGSADRAATLIRQFFQKRSAGDPDRQFTVHGPWSIVESVIALTGTELDKKGHDISWAEAMA